MAKHRINARISPVGAQKLAELAERYGTQTAALEVAIDRLYRDEKFTWERGDGEWVKKSDPQEDKP